MTHSKFNIEKFSKWLTDRGAEILPLTNEHEILRFKGKETGVIYKSGKVNSSYASKAFWSFKFNKKWDGGPINTGRQNSYKKEKALLLQRDGTDCFYCGHSLGEDITLEHLIALSSGGKNSLSNMVLSHKNCNQNVNNISINEKVKLAISQRLNKP